MAQNKKMVVFFQYKQSGQKKKRNFSKARETTNAPGLMAMRQRKEKGCLF